MLFSRRIFMLDFHAGFSCSLAARSWQTDNAGFLRARFAFQVRLRHGVSSQ
jgi:hypothetical protein